MNEETVKSFLESLNDNYYNYYESNHSIIEEQKLITERVIMNLLIEASKKGECYVIIKENELITLDNNLSYFIRLFKNKGIYYRTINKHEITSVCNNNTKKCYIGHCFQF